MKKETETSELEMARTTFVSAQRELDACVDREHDAQHDRDRCVARADDASPREAVEAQNAVTIAHATFKEKQRESAAAREKVKECARAVDLALRDEAIVAADPSACREDVRADEAEAKKLEEKLASVRKRQADRIALQHAAVATTEAIDKKHGLNRAAPDRVPLGQPGLERLLIEGEKDWTTIARHMIAELSPGAVLPKDTNARAVVTMFVREGPELIKAELDRVAAEKGTLLRAAVARDEAMRTEMVSEHDVLVRELQDANHPMPDAESRLRQLDGWIRSADGVRYYSQDRERREAAAQAREMVATADAAAREAHQQ